MVKLTIIDGPQKGEVLFSCDFKNSQVVFQHLLGTGAEWKLDLSRATYAEKAVWGAYDAYSRCARALRGKRVVWINGKVIVFKGRRKFSAVMNEVGTELDKLPCRRWLQISDDRRNDLVIRSAAGPAGWN